MIEKIKKLTLRGLMSDEDLMYGLVLKGGNALQLVYELTDRASLDIDFSMENDFTPAQFEFLTANLAAILNSAFNPEGLVVFDVKFIEKPKSSKVEIWKGYELKFKIIDADKYDPDPAVAPKMRMLAYKIYPDQSQQFIVEISSFEYTRQKRREEKDGTVFFVYTPEMIIFEKIRALCQSMPEYSQIIPTARVKGRARDFYDIWNLCRRFEDIDFGSELNKEMFKDIFAAKRVPMEFLDLLETNKDFQRDNWLSVQETIPTDDNKGFDFFFDFVQEIIQKVKS